MVVLTARPDKPVFVVNVLFKQARVVGKPALRVDAGPKSMYIYMYIDYIYVLSRPLYIQYL